MKMVLKGGTADEQLEQISELILCKGKEL